MPELRQDPTTREWTIIATERAKRPHDFRRREASRDDREYDSACPFCPGHEARTPPEVLAYRDQGTADTPGWKVRVVPNQYAALLPQGTTERRVAEEFFRTMDGVGYHEVIIETPAHNRFLPSMSQEEVEAVLSVYRDRYLALRQDRRVKYILLFKNHGEGAGTSLSHPHSQLVATPVVPANLRRKYDEAIRYHDATGRCVYCDVVEAELKARRRIVLETRGFLVFHPFASQGPFETWIVPRRFCSSFGLVNDEEIRDLAGVLKRVLGVLSETLNDPDYNYVVNSAPVGDEDEDFYLWHIQILPRLTRLAGFELGSGMRISIARPEQTASFLRDALGQLK